QLAPRLVDHRRGEVDADHLRLWEAARDHERARACSRPEVERPRRGLLKAFEGGFVRRVRAGASPIVPDGREPLELEPEQGAKDAPEPRAAHREVRREARELPPEL